MTAGVTGHELEQQERLIRLKLEQATALRSDHNDFQAQIRRKAKTRFRVGKHGREEDPAWALRYHACPPPR